MATGRRYLILQKHCRCAQWVPVFAATRHTPSPGKVPPNCKQEKLTAQERAILLYCHNHITNLACSILRMRQDREGRLVHFLCYSIEFDQNRIRTTTKSSLGSPRLFLSRSRSPGNDIATYDVKGPEHFRNVPATLDTSRGHLSMSRGNLPKSLVVDPCSGLYCDINFKTFASTTSNSGSCQRVQTSASEKSHHCPGHCLTSFLATPVVRRRVRRWYVSDESVISSGNGNRIGILISKYVAVFGFGPS